MKSSELKNLSAEELIKKEKELRDELGNLSFQHKIRPLEDTSRLKKIRKDMLELQPLVAKKQRTRFLGHLSNDGLLLKTHFIIDTL
jgi:large subunit ribosomal protein L29